MPATLTPDDSPLAVGLSRGPAGLWKALLRSDPQHQGLPTVAIGTDGPVPSMFDYDPTVAVPLDPSPTPAE